MPHWCEAGPRTAVHRAGRGARAVGLRTHSDATAPRWQPSACRQCRLVGRRRRSRWRVWRLHRSPRDTSTSDILNLVMLAMRQLPTGGRATCTLLRSHTTGCMQPTAPELVLEAALAAVAVVRARAPFNSANACRAVSTCWAAPASPRRCNTPAGSEEGEEDSELG